MNDLPPEGGHFDFPSEGGGLGSPEGGHSINYSVHHTQETVFFLVKLKGQRDERTPKHGLGI